MDELQSLTSGFVARTVSTAELIAREYHKARRAHSDAGAMAGLEAAIAKLRACDSLKLVPGGIAGGIKVVDTRNEAFFKISEDHEDIYAGSPVMADKPAKHELAAVGFLHEALDGVHLTTPLVSCVDVTVRDGAASRVYRVQAFSLLAIDGSTLRAGSSDSGLTTHVCEAMRAPMESVARVFHLAPGTFRGSADCVTVHSYELQVAPGRETSALAEVGPAVRGTLEGLGVGLDAAESSGSCAQLEAMHGVVLDPCRDAGNRYLSWLASEGGVPAGAVGPDGSIVHVLPFDVEGHMLPSGERCIVDTHRLCIPEVLESSSAVPADAEAVAVVVAADGTASVVPCACVSGSADDMAAAAATAAGLGAAAAAGPHFVEYTAGTGCVVVSWDGAEEVVIVSHPSLYWTAPGLTALYPPTAAGVLRAADVPAVCPDALIRGGDVYGLRVATAELLSEANLGRAADAVRRSVLDCAAQGSDDVASLRGAVKAGLHDCGLGLRHAWRVWRGLLFRPVPSASTSPTQAGGAAFDGTGSLVACAYVSACLPRPGSSAALALEQLMLGTAAGQGATDRQHSAAWAAVCLASRASAVKGLGVDTAGRCALARQLLESPSTAGVVRSWLYLQRLASSSVKMAGLGGKQQSRLSHAESGVAFRSGAEAAGSALLAELRHRQQCGVSGSEAGVLRRLGELANRELGSPDQGLLVLLRDYARMPAGEERDLRVGLERVGQLLQKGGRYREALEAHELVLRGRVSSGGEDQERVASSWSSIGVCRFELDEHEVALDAHERALRIRSALLGDDHCDVGESWFHIGACRSKLGDFSGALEAHEQALRVREASLGADHPDVGQSWNSIGYCLTSTGKHAEALEALDRGLRIRTSSLGEWHPDVGLSWNNTGICLSSMKRFARAIEAYKRAKRIQVASLGESHPDVARSLSNIATGHLGMEDPASAAKCWESCLPILSASLGEKHSQVAMCWSSIAVCYHKLDDHGKAIKASEACLEIRQSTLAETDPVLHQTYHDYALALRKAGDITLAQHFYELWRNGLQASMGEDHIEVARGWAIVGSQQYHLGCFADAWVSFEHALRIRVSALGDDHLDVAEVLICIGSCHMAMEGHSKAVEAYQQAMRIQVLQLTDSHPSVATTWGHIGAAQADVSAWADALASFERALAIQRATLGESHLEVGRSWGSVGECLAQLGALAKAAEAYQAAVDIKSSSLAEASSEIGNDYFAFGSCNLALGNFAGALQCFEEARVAIAASSEEAVPEQVASLWTCIATCNTEMGKHADALIAAENAVHSRLAAHGEIHLDVGHGWGVVGICHSNVGNDDMAVAAFERMVAIASRVSSSADPAFLASTGLSLIGTPALIVQQELHDAAEPLEGAVEPFSHMYRNYFRALNNVARDQCGEAAEALRE